MVEKNKAYSATYSSSKKQKLLEILLAKIIELEDNNKGCFNKFFGGGYNTSLGSSISIISAVKNGDQIIGKDLAYKDIPKLLLVQIIDYNYKMNKE
jgi:hypothetical protein